MHSGLTSCIEINPPRCQSPPMFLRRNSRPVSGPASMTFASGKSFTGRNAAFGPTSLSASWPSLVFNTCAGDCDPGLPDEPGPHPPGPERVADQHCGRNEGFGKNRGSRCGIRQCPADILDARADMEPGPVSLRTAERAATDQPIAAPPARTRPPISPNMECPFRGAILLYQCVMRENS